MKSLSQKSFSLGRSLAERIKRSPAKAEPGGGSGGDREAGLAPGRAAAAAAAAGIQLGPTDSKAEREAVLLSLPSEYYSEEFDPLDHELRQLPPNFEAGSLDSVVEQRTAVLDVVSEKLSHHVIQNYDKFVEGVNEVIHVEEDLQAAHTITKTSRERLALALREVGNSIRIAKDTRRKQALTSLLEVLARLQQANNLQRALKEAQEEGQYAEAFWLCAQCIKSMDELGEGLQVATQLTVSINRMYEDTTQRLESALAAVCNDFRPSHYTKVLEGYMFLGNVEQLGSEVKTAYVNTINSAVQKVVRGVLLTRPGFEEKAAVASNLQELVRYLPSDLFRTCLARVLMVLFDILVSHFHMVRWHEASLERHQQELAALTQARQALQQRLGGGGGSSSAAAAAEGGPGSDAWEAASSSLEGQLQQQQHQPRADQADALPAANGYAAPSAGGLLIDDDGGSGSPVTVTGRAMMQLQRGTPSELEEVEAKESDEEEWGAVLRAVHAGLVGGRKLIWDEAARRISVLLSAPAAFEGEHFLQVMDWTQHAQAVGESFSGVECAGLRTLLQRQSGNFFRAFHTSNIEALNSMLDKEMWKRLPVAMPSLAEALLHRSGSEDAVGSSADFEQHVTRGNPWRRQQGSPRKRPKAVSRLGFAGATSLEDGRTAHQLDVDEYGIPRTASTDATGSSRTTSDQSEAPATPGKDAEPDELYGDYIDEETQSVRTASGEDASTSGREGGSGAAVVTNSSWRMMKWMRDYCQLMRTLTTATPAIFAGVTELYDLYLLHIYLSFGEVPLPDLLAAAQHPPSGGGMGGSGAAGDALTPRLRSTLLRIASDSIGKYRGLLGGQPGSKLAKSLVPRDPGSPSISAYNLDSLKDKLSLKDTAGAYFGRKAVPGSPGPGTLGAAGAGGALAALAGGEVAMISNSGNLYGLQERAVAVESLAVVAGELARAGAELSAALPHAEAHALDQFYARAVGAAEDLHEHVLRAGARLLLPIRWLPDRIGGTNYGLSEPPTTHQPWVDELERSLDHFRDRLSTVSSLSKGALSLLWGAAAAYVAESVLEGIVRVKRCTLEGRAAMSVDLQGLARVLQGLLPREVPVNLRLVDNYVKGFYMPLEELTRWAAVHPEYRPDQVLALTALVAENSGLKRKDKAALLAKVEGDLRALSLGEG